MYKRQGQDTLKDEFMMSTGGAYFWMRITARILRQKSDGSLHMLTYRQNIDAEKRQENRLQELAQLDEMTGLLTKTATRRHIEHLLKEKPDQLYAFFILDIDTFKQANDLYGHASVSYTHLDVYKRQVHCCLSFAPSAMRIGGAY